MPRCLRSMIAVILAALCVSLSAPVAAQPGPPTARDWTLIIYMNGKNSLELDALNNFNAMASVGSSDRLAIVAELGRPKEHYTSAEGNWSGVYRFLVGKGQKPRPASAVEKVAAGVASDMGKPDTLSDFIAWSKKRYPAKHYMVVIWNHGQGYRLMFSRLMARMSPTEKSMLQVTPNAANGRIGGYRAVSSDEDTRSILYNAEVNAAIARNFVAGDKLDLLGFDACLMSMMETAYALDGNVKLMVASEDLEQGDGWQYKHLLTRLAAAPAMSPEALGRAVVETFGARYTDTYATLSLLNLSGTRAAATSLSSFAEALRSAGPGELQAMRAARGELSEYGDWDNPPLHLSVDLVTLLDRFRLRTANAGLSAQAASTAAAINAMVLANYASPQSRGGGGEALYGSNGLAIYYPKSKAAFLDDPFHSGYLKANTDRPVAFVRDERWADLLYDLLGVH